MVTMKQCMRNYGKMENELYFSVRFNYNRGNGSKLAKEQKEDFPCRKDEGLRDRSEMCSM